MKKLLFFIIIIISLTSRLNGQNYWPYSHGDKVYTWNFRYYDCNKMGENYYFRERTILTDTVMFLGEIYYKLAGYYYHYSSTEKKLYTIFNGEKVLAMNFNKYAGSDTLCFMGEKKFFYYKGDSLIYINNIPIKVFKVEYKGGKLPYRDNRIIFANGIGLFQYRSFYGWSEPGSLHSCWKDTTNTTKLVKIDNQIISMYPIPKVLKVDWINDDKALVTVKNDSLYGADNLILERKSETDSSFIVIGSIPNTANTFNDNGISGGKSYLYRVRIKLWDEILAPSTEYYYNGLSIPTGIVQDTSIPEGIKLKWTFTSNYCDSFIVERKTKLPDNNWSEYVKVGSVNKNSREYYENDYSKSAKYKYRIKVNYNNRSSNPSEEKQVYPKVKLQNVSNFYVDLGEDEKVMVYWQNVNTFTTATYLQRKLSNSSSFDNIYSSYNVNNSYNDENFVQLMSYDYRIKCYLNPNSIIYSEIISIDIPLFPKPIKPENFAGILLPDKKVKLTWEYTMPYIREFYLTKKYDSYNKVYVRYFDRLMREFVDEVPSEYQTVKYELMAISKSTFLSDPAVVTIMMTDQSEMNVFKEFGLNQNYPNPFNPVTSISYTLKERRTVKLVIYDVLGKVVAEPVNEEKEAGRYKVDFDGSKLPSGTYYYRIMAGDFIETKKMLLLK